MTRKQPPTSPNFRPFQLDGCIVVAGGFKAAREPDAEAPMELRIYLPPGEGEKIGKIRKICGRPITLTLERTQGEISFEDGKTRAANDDTYEDEDEDEEQKVGEPQLVE